MPDYAVMTAFNGRDNVSHIFDEMRRSADRFGDSARSNMRGVGREADHASTALRNASKHGYKFGAIVKGILAANAIRGGIGYVTSGLQKIGSDYLEFGDTMTGAVARFDEVDTRSAGFGKEIARSSLLVRNALVGTRHAAVDGAMAYNELAKAGYSSQAAIGILPNLAAFATAAQEKLGEATAMSSQILGGFGMRSENVQVQLKNHIKLNDMLTKSSLMATGDLRDMFETMKIVAPLAKQKGIAPETALAMATALSNAGIMGDEAGTAMKRGFLSFYGPRMAERLVASGINPYDKAGNRRKITDVYADFARVVGGRKPSEQEAAYVNVFGLYGMSGNVKLTQELSNIAKYEAALSKAQGTSRRLADAANTSPLAKLKMLGNAVMEKGFQVLDQYAAPGKSGVETLIEKVQKFDVRPLIDGISMVGKTLYVAYKMAEPFIPFIPYMVAGFYAWRGAMVALTGVRFLSTVITWVRGTEMMAEVLGGAGLFTALSAILVPIAAITANFVIWREVLSSLKGQDNFISRAAQSIGLVPKLATDADGNVIGRSEDQYPWFDKGDVKEAPNTSEAKARTQTWKGYLQFGNLPEGSKMNGMTLDGKSHWEFLGANP